MDNETKQMFELILKKLDNLEESNKELKVGQEELRVGQEELKASQEELKTSHEELKVSHEELKASHEELKEGQRRIEEKLNVVYEHTAKITEDITATNMKLDELIEEIDFVKYKEQQAEKDIFKLKKNLNILN